MEYYDVLILGGGVAGSRAAVAAREKLPKAKVGLISRDPIVYTRMSLSYVLKAGVKDIEYFAVYHPHELTSLNIDFLNDVAVEIDASAKRVKTLSGRVFEYDKLILSTGSVPNVPEVEGRELRGVYTFHTFEDAVKLLEAAEPGKKALVVGAGMIGLLVADGLSSLGVSTVLVDLLPDIARTALDPPLSEHLRRRVERLGVRFIGGVSVEKLEGAGKVERAKLSNGEVLEVDLVVFCTGVRPNVPSDNFALGPGKSLLTNELFETSVKDVYAIGDCASTIDYITKRHVYRPLGILAIYAANVLSGVIAEGRGYEGFLVYQLEEAFGTTFIRLGLNGIEAKALGVNYGIVEVGYRIPGVGYSTSLVLYERGSDRIIGWQSVGATLASYKSKVFEHLIKTGGKLGDLEGRRVEILRSFT